MPEKGAPRRPAATRPFWSGTISFGLVTVPVDLYPGVRGGSTGLRMLAPDGTPLERRYVCPAHDREVSRDELVRGYEVEPGEYVVVTDEELEALAPEKSRDIDLRLFVDRDAIDPFHFDRPYFLAPSGDSTKAYRLLADAMEREGRAGLATFVMRGKGYLVAILADAGILCAETLRFEDEVRGPEDVGLDDLEGGPSEPKTAQKKRVTALKKELEGLTESSFDPTELEDRWAERLRDLVERKRGEGQVAKAEEAPAEDEEELAEVVDLMDVLKRSLQGSGQSAGRGREAAGGDGAGGKAPKKGGKDDLRERTKQELYEQAKDLDVPGRSSMTKDELVAAIRAAG